MENIHEHSPLSGQSFTEFPGRQVYQPPMLDLDPNRVQWIEIPPVSRRVVSVSGETPNMLLKV
ncbi:MAG TPA: hypothetical protein VKU00_28025 [Chthonomonadaceae bacterium]|nr:hypothetical protein [Chthonomonadaceae bacterium]